MDRLSEISGSKSYLFYDGDCPLCIRAVKWVLSKDPKLPVLFIPLKSIKDYIPHDLYSSQLETMETVVYFKNNVIYTHSDAIIEIARDTKTHEFLINCFAILPKSFRDLIYKLVANHRYIFWNKANENCPIQGNEVLKDHNKSVANI
jgi:predicted DCC family thiol-disulfide oxidoreductase YuxK